MLAPLRSARVHTPRAAGGALLAAAIALAGCDAAHRLVIPDDVAFVVTLEPDARSPLAPVDRAAALMAGDLDATTVLGFSSAQLSPPLAGLDAAEPLAVESRGCGFLPSASWARRFEGGDAVETPAPDVPLGAQWMRAGCSAPAQVHATCRGFRVCSGPPDLLTDACAWSIGCSDNTVLRVDAGVWPSAPGCARLGSSAAAPPVPLTYEAWSPRGDGADYRAIATIDGDSCVISAGPVPEPPLLIPTTDSVRVWRGNPRVPSTLDSDESPFVDVRGTDGGGITGALLDLPRRRAIVAVTDGVVCPNPNTMRGTWRTVDLDATVLSTRTVGRAPPCLTGVRRVSADGERLRVVGFTVDPVRNFLTGYEFDEGLVEVRRRSLATLLDGALVADVLITPTAWFVLSAQTGRSPRSLVHSIDPVTLAVTATLAASTPAAHTIEAGERGELHLFMRDRPEVCITDTTLLPVRCEVACGPDVSSSASSVLKLTALARDPADGAPVLAATDAFHGLLACGRKLWMQPPGGVALLVGVTALGPGRMLTSAIGRWGGGPWRGRLYVADLASGGFDGDHWELPGTLVTSFLRDGDRLWLVLPWDGRLIRWTPPR